MTKKLTATEAKARFLQLLDDAEAGEDTEITRHGRTVARIVPASGPQALRGRMIGIARSAAAEDDLFTTGVTWDAE